MRLTGRAIFRVILVAVALSAGLWLLSDNSVSSAPASATIKRTIAPGVEAGWVRNGNTITDADGDAWECSNLDAVEPGDWNCKVSNPSAQVERGDNPAVALRLESGQWLIFEKRGDNELIDTTGATWTCATRTAGATLAANGCSRRG